MRVRRYDRRARGTRLGFALALMIGAWLALASAPASALVTRPLISTFESAEDRAFAATVDNSTGPAGGELYVSVKSEAGSVIRRFPAGGGASDLTIDGSETPQGSLSLWSFPYLAGIAVDGSSGANAGDLYVSSIEQGVVDRFKPSGEFDCEITGAATPGISECDPLGSETQKEREKPGEARMEPTGVAVDPRNGDVYVSDLAHDVVDEFGPGGEYLGDVEDPHIAEPGALAVNSVGDLYVAPGNLATPGPVVELSAGGAFLATVGTEAYSVAVDLANDHVLVGEAGAQVDEFDSSGKKLGKFGYGENVLAVDDTTGEVYSTAGPYLTDSTIGVYGPAIVTPEAVSEPASGVQERSATFHGRAIPDVEDGGGPTNKCEFEYVTEAQFNEAGYEGAAVAACAPAVPYTEPTVVSANVTLLASTTYHFRLTASDPGVPPLMGGASTGESEVLTTRGPAAVDSESVKAITTSATAHAQINPYGHDTTCTVQYVDEASFKSSGYADATSVPCVPADLGSGFGDQGTEAAFGGLSVGTTYHYRFVASSGAGTTAGTDETFSTFGVSSFTLATVDQEGRPYTQAGGHPYKLINTFTLAETSGYTDANLKDAQTELPPGIFANTTATPKCTRADLTAELCSPATEVGIFKLAITGETIEEGLYNMVPPAGVPVEFGTRVAHKINVFIDSNVRAGGDYGVTSGALNASTDADVRSSTVEVWGVPADPSHDAERFCPGAGGGSSYGRGCAAGVPAKPFLTNPSLCGGPRTATMRADSWQDPGAFVTATSVMPPVTGCDKLYFPPSITVLPDTSAADSPSGVSVNLLVPQNGESPQTLGTPSLRNVVVMLPAGVALNPADANGLQACSEAQIGLESDAQPTCPDASKVGSAEIETPLLPDRLEGSVYLAAQNENPFGSLLALYVAVHGDGALIKVAGRVEPDPVTGQLTTTFDDTPQLPFSDFRLHFFGGPRAPLATPKLCGTYDSTAVFTPWSAPESGPPATQSFPFAITTGPEGAPCQDPLPFAAALTAGTTSIQAGGFSPFTMTMTRQDGEQNLNSVQLRMPPGLLGTLSTVKLCGEAQADAGTCGPESLIGHTTVSVGVGKYPFSVAGGEVFITGPYRGAPYGLSIVNPAKAGPLDLGKVIVRAKIEVDPTTSQLTITTDQSGPYRIPTILDGIPLEIRFVNVTIDRPQFTFNPTNCDPLPITGSLTSSEGASSDEISVPFQVTNCAVLAFKPHLAASTSGKTSRANGASLAVKLAYPAGPYDANIAKVKVELPKALPSRLTTLQKACPAAVFESNPAGCPAASIVGHATASTPVLPVPLSGPAYFVSHGGEAFPSLIVVLQGYGVTVHLVGSTFISKAGITSSTFKTIPDVPVGTFELTLPQGPYSALAATGNFCKQQLAMPTEFVGQNGALIKTTTKIAVTGCPKAKKTSHKKKRKAKRGKHGKKK